jgi:hypothetical protein
MALEEFLETMGDLCEQKDIELLNHRFGRAWPGAPMKPWV